MRRPTIHGATGHLSLTERIALACRVLEQQHEADVLARMALEMGDRGLRLGRPVMVRNTLRAYVSRVNRTRMRPPFVSGLEPELAAMLGDHMGAVLQQRYAGAGGWPMPSGLLSAAVTASGLRIGAGSAALALSWSERRQGVVVDYIRPSELQLHYGTDDPDEPTVIRHKRIRLVDGEEREVWDVYDLTATAAPSFRVETSSGAEIALERAMPEGSLDALRSWWWRGPDGRPFHRIVVTGRPEDVWKQWQLVEMALTMPGFWTHFKAGVVDAGHPQRSVRGLRRVGKESADGQQGGEAGPEDVLVFEDINPDRPGQFHQWGPGFDPESIGRALRSFEFSALSAQGLPVDMEGTGGEPTEQERQAFLELTQCEYPADRRLDSEVLRRAAWIANRATQGTSRRTAFTGDYGVLYGDEITAALGESQGGTTEE